MAINYVLREVMEPVSYDPRNKHEAPVLLVLTSREFEDYHAISQHIHDELDLLEAAENNYVEEFGTYVIGSFEIPNKLNLQESDPGLLSFYMDEYHLIFIDDSDVAKTLVERFVHRGTQRRMTLGHCLLMFFRELLDNDLIYLGELEDEMEDIEEAMLERDEDVETRQIAAYRRFSMRMSAYYQQLAIMATLLAENENDLLEEEDARNFEHVAQQADRLINRTETIKEYSMQLRELYQTRIDLRQNAIMQIFTIVTVLFAPLTLITGWFGMNLEVLPGLDWPFMALFLVCLAIVLVAICLFVFHRKRWI